MVALVFIALICALSIALVFVSAIPAFVAPAYADEVSDARAQLAAAEARMAELAEEHEVLQKEAEALQTEIDATAAEALEVQADMLAGREALGAAAQYEYRGARFPSFFELLLSSGSFSELIRNMEYLDSVQSYYADLVQAQERRAAELSRVTQELNEKRDAQEVNLRALEQKQEEAAQLVSQARANLANAQAAEAARIAELERLAAELEASKNNSSGAGGGSASDEEVRDENANTPDREDAVSPETPVQPDPKPDSGASSATGWQSGIASAYGGETDEWTPNPGTTATGDVCDDYSMGVAVPMAWPQYWKYYGRTVEISYGGMTVFAVVNDCGYMGGGSRVLDLQPGVWKAFGFTSCNSWGLRTVSYRFL
ncbi:MAG: hypothetical protein IJC51_00185 [Eggerthellaceae bacterium]|nr:hypothetical protein [Eggerthellaceae bacterium]